MGKKKELDNVFFLCPLMLTVAVLVSPTNHRSGCERITPQESDKGEGEGTKEKRKEKREKRKEKREKRKEKREKRKEKREKRKEKRM